METFNRYIDGGSKRDPTTICVVSRIRDAGTVSLRMETSRPTLATIQRARGSYIVASFIPHSRDYGVPRAAHDAYEDRRFEQAPVVFFANVSQCSPELHTVGDCALPSEATRSR